MQMSLGYLGKSEVVPEGERWSMRFSPNLSRPKVSFDGDLRHPLRFREAISALHDVVVGDLKHKPKDRAAYQQWKLDEAKREAGMREQLFRDLKQAELQGLAKEPVPPDLEPRFRKMHQLYWTARRRWASELSSNDPELFRHLVPCDPVVTVAPDVVYFECFSKDESSYGCLLVDREAFGGAGSAELGTTNVDYSLALYDHFQTLRTYRPTRLLVDPTGFAVKVATQSTYREEKIDLPPSWLRGFSQLQGAMTLPARKVSLEPEAVYSILAYLIRHREKSGPRSLRFELTPGKPPAVVLDPWNVRIEGRAHNDVGERPETIKVWGRRRLFALARVLPLAERVDVYLLGNGLPSIWVAQLGEMRFVLALSGWTANDWTSGASLELLSGEKKPDPAVMTLLLDYLSERQSAPLGLLSVQAGNYKSSVVLGSLFELAKRGQIVYDFSTQLYRYRQVMPAVLSETVLGPEPVEVSEGRAMDREGLVKISREEPLSAARRLVVAKADGTSVEAIFDSDGGYSKAKCSCSHFHKYRLRAGPCRHLIALRLAALKRTRS